MSRGGIRRNNRSRKSGSSKSRWKSSRSSWRRIRRMIMRRGWMSRGGARD